MNVRKRGAHTHFYNKNIMYGKQIEIIPYKKVEFMSRQVLCAKFVYVHMCTPIETTKIYAKERGKFYFLYRRTMFNKQTLL